MESTIVMGMLLLALCGIQWRTAAALLHRAQAAHLPLSRLTREYPAVLESLDQLRDSTDEEVLKLMGGVCEKLKHRPKVEQTVNDMSMLYMTETGHLTLSMYSPEQIWSHPNFAGKSKLVIYVPGWMRNNMLENEMFLGLYAAYRLRGDTNFVMFDTSKYYYDLESWETFDIDQAGMMLGGYLSSLLSAVNLENVHLIGHSLGAHIAGAAARRFQTIDGHKIPRITALDPNILCDKPGHGRSMLRTSDAAFVDVIHTNPNVFGMAESLGHVDFYVNGLNSIQPGTQSSFYSHARAVSLFVETVVPGREFTMMAGHCSTSVDLIHGHCSKSEMIPMGIATPTDAKPGDYYLETSGTSPYGLSTPFNVEWLRKTGNLEILALDVSMLPFQHLQQY